MSNLSERIKIPAMIVCVAVFLTIGVVIAYNSGKSAGTGDGFARGLSVGREQAVDQARNEIAIEEMKFLFVVSVQLAEQQQNMALSVIPRGPDPKSPPPHDTKYYMDIVRDRVTKAGTPELKESEYWASVCIAQRELVGAPMTVWTGERINAFTAFGQEAGPYYMDLVIRHQVSFYSRNLLEVTNHVALAMKTTPCPAK